VNGNQLILMVLKLFYDRAAAVENVKSAEYNYKLVSSELAFPISDCFWPIY